MTLFNQFSKSKAACTCCAPSGLVRSHSERTVQSRGLCCPKVSARQR